MRWYVQRGSLLQDLGCSLVFFSKREETSRAPVNATSEPSKRSSESSTQGVRADAPRDLPCRAASLRHLS